jgi:hypothetical protein
MVDRTDRRKRVDGQHDRRQGAKVELLPEKIARNLDAIRGADLDLLVAAS